ncbi:helix-turn-helix domain-containing protein [Enterococcus wangshanyuanii]|uniref:Transcriptional regulator n=1 Tax=Enterococcus wangshanyuanii TaxID=2005703 RepID=A0ABQ1PFG6_9ENTE|nr:helix-turn-helix domain-containing protein [Enterococcus wangshanyuanii]GGC96295.1 transcriptional regulator [Enterococcus wangshanyuanii]
MDKFDLLEKMEAYQIDLLIYIINSGGTATKKELLTHLRIGDYLLSKLLENLMTHAKNSNNGFSIDVIKHTVRFQTKPEYSIHTLFNKLITHAPKYQILKKLLLCGTIDPIPLCEKIGISHSTYFRKINELNNLLKEFDLSIQNGYLLGSELQIRFFYVSLLFITDSKQPLKINDIDPRIHDTVNKIQTILGSPLSFLSKRKLIIYLSLLKRRNAQKGISDYNDQFPFFSNKTGLHNQKRFIRLLKTSTLFRKIDKVLTSFLVYYSFKMTPNETILLILFLLGEEIIPSHSYCLKELDVIEKKSNLFILTLNNEFLDFMEFVYPDTQLTKQHRSMLDYHLSSIGYRHLIFKGHINYYWDAHLPSHEESHRFTIIYAFIDYMKKKYPTLFNDDSQTHFLTPKYAYTLNLYEEWIKAKVTVGVFIEGNLLFRKQFTKWWINYAELTTFAQAEPLVTDKPYDLVISNIDWPSLKKQGRHFFFITNYNEQMDKMDLNELLYKIYSSHC